MSECCTSKPSDASNRESVQQASCPICHAKGKPISTRTVKSLVRDHTRVSQDRVYWLCRVMNCDVVYFSEAVSFYKPDLKVRVGFKEQQDPIPLCYCFDYTRSDISCDLGLRGETDIPDRVRAEIQRGFCACDVKNPSGACCLGDLTRPYSRSATILERSRVRSLLREVNLESSRKRRSGSRDTRGIVSVGLLFAFWNCWRSGSGKHQCLDRSATSMAARCSRFTARFGLLADLSSP